MLGYQQTESRAAKISDSPDLDYGRRSRPRSVSYLLTGFSPAWRPFGHIACWCNAVFRFLQATLETCSSSQFRASRFIALSLQTIKREITCNYNSSLANILNSQVSSILRMCQHRSDILSAHTKHGGFGFIKFCKFTKSQKRNNLLFLTPLYNSTAKSQCGSVSKY